MLENNDMKTCVLDIETIPNAVAVAQASVDVSVVFPPWSLHELACVSILTIESDGVTEPTFSIATYSRSNLGERGIIASVERALSQAFEVVTFNGRGFDVPVLLARAAVCGEPAPTVARLYAQRRSTRGLHVDLLEEVTGYGAAPRLRLLDLCSAFQIPVKFDCAGDNVAALVDQGAWPQIAAYCETDVVATWLALQFWRSAERSDPELIVLSWARVARWICAGGDTLAHLAIYSRPPRFFAGGGILGEVDFAELGL